jgi:hypothetical protein
MKNNKNFTITEKIYLSEPFQAIYNQLSEEQRAEVDAYVGDYSSKIENVSTKMKDEIFNNNQGMNLIVSLDEALLMAISEKSKNADGE